MAFSLEKIVLTNSSRTPLATSNLGDVNVLEETIYKVLEENPNADKLYLGKYIGQALVATRKFCVLDFSLNIAQTKMQKKRIVLDAVRPGGNIENLWIFLSEEPECQMPTVITVPSCNIKNFYLGSIYDSGIKATTLKEFLEYIIAEVKQAEDDGADHFDLTIETE